MCVGVPMQILSVDGIAAMARDGVEEVMIDLSLTGPVEPGGQSDCRVEPTLIPAEVQGSEAQIFYLGACADDTDLVSEADETDNCQLGNAIFVPEPGGAALACAGCVALFLLARYRQRRRCRRA